MSSNLQTKIPVNAKFGLHGGSLGELPTLEWLTNIKTLARTFEFQLLTIDISTLLAATKSHPDAEIELSAPTLGFTDPAFDFETTSWFAIPLVINGFVAKSKNTSTCVANVFVTDIMDNQYALKFDKQGRIDFSAIAAAQSSVIYTTLKCIQYRYTVNQLVNGEGLQQLAKKEYQNKILLMLPKEHAGFQLECALVAKQKKVMVKQYAVAASEPRPNGMQVETQWQGDVKQGRLQVDYQRQNQAVKSNVFEAELSVLLPQAQNLQYLIYGSQTWLNTHQSKQPCLTQYYGLSAEALLVILKALVPYSVFCQKLPDSGFCQNLGLENVNLYEKNGTHLATLYRYLLSAVINRSLPLYALKPYMNTKPDVFEETSSLDVSKWSVHDQMVYQQIFSSIKQVIPSVEVIWDTLDSYFSFGSSDFAGKLLLDTQGATLSKTPEVSVTLLVKSDRPTYPLEGKWLDTMTRDALVDTPLRKPTCGDSAQEDVE